MCNKHSLVITILSVECLSFSGLAWTFKIPTKQAAQEDQLYGGLSSRHYVLQTNIWSLLKHKSLYKIATVKCIEVGNVQIIIGPYCAPRHALRD
jgi:hypothetical protein